jgi:8-oxo-dGTP pyrophosphatase MutT (NUDIX family)
MTESHPIVTALADTLAKDAGMIGAELPQAAVLIALLPSADQLTVILTRRAAHMRQHPGEVAFPGGKCDPEDEDHWATALREANEEIGLPVHLVQRLGVLPPLVTRSGIEVTACVGLLREAVEFIPNPEELDAVFCPPLEFFCQEGELHLDPFEYRGAMRQVPRYEYGEFTIWGMTAAMLIRLVNIACGAAIELETYWKGEDT